MEQKCCYTFEMVGANNYVFGNLIRDIGWALNESCMCTLVFRAFWCRKRSATVKGINIIGSVFKWFHFVGHLVGPGP